MGKLLHNNIQLSEIKRLDATVMVVNTDICANY